MSLLEIQDVTHTYATGSGRPVLHDVNLSTGEGEIVALVGESGCGKTTLGRLIAGLHEPSSGRISFDGTDIAGLRGNRRRQWRRKVQMVHQDPYGSLNPGLTIGSTLAPGILQHKLATWRTVQPEMIKLLQQVGLDATPAFLQRYPHQLSGGQRQRVSIARAISLQPSLIVADEVTSMLDVSMRVAILDLLLSFQRDRGIGYVFISHDFGVVRYFAQGGRIAVMFFGYIVEEGPVEELITSPRHPYTHMLLQAIPVPDPVLVRKRDEEGRDPERMIGEPATSGCVFANRCPLVQDVCRKQAPALTEIGTGHRSACHFSDEVPPLVHLTDDAA
ncbi:ABC transporter ATP-binding protein [Microlunatus parietis]|uniref:Oligopeptide/dipeptide ABC transporter ATP-binding protein n=1 Tax=Microlunatus parietis TaxID=682979 RepID=A0A7Y9LB48_9ACTN|nr:ABC transporter ATP-binding protein [Microlunatus parietis]NYE69451.1 oligopeptide/dipeptide ABC transporter ATP-binding protein [Microlunatus parietis]